MQHFRPHPRAPEALRDLEKAGPVVAIEGSLLFAYRLPIVAFLVTLPFIDMFFLSQRTGPVDPPSRPSYCRFFAEAA
jgi:hypothetical protein